MLFGGSRKTIFVYISAAFLSCRTGIPSCALPFHHRKRYPAWMDETFGLIETVETVVHIYMLTAHLPGVNTVRDYQMVGLAEYFGVKYPQGLVESLATKIAAGEIFGSDDFIWRRSPDRKGSLSDIGSVWFCPRRSGRRSWKSPSAIRNYPAGSSSSSP